jgi:hypothetical protein
MRALLSFLVYVMVGTFAAQVFAQTPKELAGFVMGSDIEQYRSRLQFDTALPIRDMRFLTEIQIKEVEGYRKGYLVYGTCEHPQQIVRIKLKYADESKRFYDRLLAAFRKTYGKPDEWRGDAFHHFVAWKWSMRDEQGNSISMILQHSTADDLEHPKGNTIKLTNWSQIERERRCYESKQPAAKDEPKEAPVRPIPDFEYYLPR